LCGLITDECLPHLQVAKKLRVLRLTGTAITDAGLAQLTAFPSLIALDLEICEQISDDGCQSLGEMTQLRALVLKKTGFEPKRISVVGLTKLAGLSNLELLSLYGNPLKDEGLAEVAKLTRLRDLDLSLTAVTDAGLTHLSSLENLGNLQLLYSEGFAGPKITDAGLENLAVHQRLRSLDLVGAKVTDAGLEHLHSLERLELIRLSNTRLSDEGIKRLQDRLPNCKIVR
jgi:internalin A